MPGGSQMRWTCAIVSALLCSQPALAGTAQLMLEGRVAPVCTVVGAATAINLGEASHGAVADAGAIGVTCNLVDSGPTVTLSSLNRGLLLEGSDQRIAYGMEWDLPGTSAFDAVSSVAGTISAQLDAFAPGTTRSAHLLVKVAAAATAGKQAGTYRDVIVISISP